MLTRVLASVRSFPSIAAPGVPDSIAKGVDRVLEVVTNQPPRNHSVVITASGPDRPGIVHDLTKLLTTAGANVEESRMSILGNDFAILLRVTVGDALADSNKL